MCTLACIFVCIFLFIGKKYPVIETFRAGKVKTCENDKLKLKKSYKVDRIEVEKSPPKYRFRATLDEEEISSLNGEKGGICDLVSTEKRSRGCGLATTLMEHCFTDENVGSLDIQKTRTSKESPLKNGEIWQRKIVNTWYILCAMSLMDQMSRVQGTSLLLSIQNIQ